MLFRWTLSCWRTPYCSSRPVYRWRPTVACTHPILPASSAPDQEEILKWWTAERRFTMESEIATMKFIAESTDIPVPTIFGHRTSIEGNPVKLPYMLMQCIRGNMLFDLGGPGILTSEQKSRIQKSIASIQVWWNPYHYFSSAYFFWCCA